MKKTKCIAISICLVLPIFLQSLYATTVPKLRVTPLPGTVTLILDDGPHFSITPKILAILKLNHIKANYGIIGYQAERYPELVKQIAAQGNVIVQHTLRHVDLQNATPKTIRYELTSAKKILERISKQKIYCVQPPFLRTSHKLGVIAKSAGLVVLPKAYDSYDSENISISTIVNRVASIAESGTIIDLHDTNTRTLLALPKIIKAIRAKGLGFSTICVPER